MGHLYQNSQASAHSRKRQACWNSHTDPVAGGHIHQQLGHCGRNHVLSKFRRKYLLTKAPSAIKKVLNDCWMCRLHTVRAGEQKMAEARILPDLSPFSSAGVDYFRPSEMKRGINLCKH